MLIETATIFFLSLLLIAGIRRVAPKIGLLDIPNARSAHTRAVARGAGVGFVAAALLGIVLFHYDLLMAHGWIFLAILMILVVGFLDDH
jgi:UDP-GlcNAc:undecaprenyl-phosphate GlcNAc-1-phosphate transferase